MNEWKKKMWYIYTIEYYSTLKRNKILIHATIQMSLENIMLKCEKSQETKVHVLYYFIYMKYLYWLYPFWIWETPLVMMKMIWNLTEVTQHCECQ